MNIRKIVAGLGVLTVFGVTACGSIETQSDEQAIRYSGGAIFPSDVTFKNCVGSGKQEYGSVGDNTYVYPSGQRTYVFGDPSHGDDSDPLKVSSPGPEKGSQPLEMTVRGTVTFTPNFTDCTVLRQFHETIGLKFQAYTPEGWNRMLDVYIKQTAERAADNAALQSNWIALTSSATDKAAWEASVAQQLPEMIRALSGGNFFIVDKVLLQKPDLPPTVTAAIAATETARQEAKTADQVAAAATNFPGGATAYQAFLQQQAINKAIENGSVKVIPIPQGSSVIVSGN